MHHSLPGPNDRLLAYTHMGKANKSMALVMDLPPYVVDLCAGLAVT